jgi:NAD(P)-dependent dehydrogenase (short-subunit alcohol dehydrogenase family)
MRYGVDEYSLYRPTPGQASDVNLLRGKVAVVTGANRGIGLATSTWLVRHGAEVVMTCRSLAKCRVAVDRVNRSAGDGGGGGKATSAVLDLSSLRSANDLVDEVTRRYPDGIHYLFCNAGTTPQRPLTEDGYEDGFGGMHLGHMAVTVGLLPLLNKGTVSNADLDGSSVSRVILVSSEMSINAAMGIFGPPGEMFDETNLRGERLRGDGTLAGSMPSYGRAKLCNVLLAMELNRRMNERGWPVVSNAVHTGAVVTDSSRDGIVRAFQSKVLRGLSWLVGRVYLPLLWRNVEGGSRVLLCAALSDAPWVRTGGQYLDALCRPFLPTHTTPHDYVPENTIHIPLGMGGGTNRVPIFIDPVQALLVADAKYSRWLWDTSMTLLRDSPVGRTIANAFPLDD